MTASRPCSGPMTRPTRSGRMAVKEQLRRLLRVGSLTDANHQRQLLTYYIDFAAMPETTRLLATVNTWRDAIEDLTSSPASPTPAPRPPTPRSTTSSGPGAATATPPTTEPISSCEVPPGRRHEHHLSARHHAEVSRAAFRSRGDSGVGALPRGRTASLLVCAHRHASSPSSAAGRASSPAAAGLERGGEPLERLGDSRAGEASAAAAASRRDDSASRACWVR